MESFSVLRRFTRRTPRFLGTVGERAGDTLVRKGKVKHREHRGHRAWEDEILLMEQYRAIPAVNSANPPRPCGLAHGGALGELETRLTIKPQRDPRTEVDTNVP